MNPIPEADPSSKVGGMVTTTNLFFEKLRNTISEYKIVPAVSILTSVINADTKIERLSHFWALIELYNTKPIKEQYEIITSCSSEIGEFAKFLLAVLTPVKQQTRKQKELPTMLFSELASQDQAVFEEYNKQGPEGIKFNPKLNLLEGLDGVIAQLKEEKAPMSKIFVTLFEKFHHILRPLIGLFVFIACVTGCSAMFEFKWLVNIVKDMQKCASGIIAQRVVMTQVSDCIDSMLEGIYAFTGNTYIRQKHRHLINLNKDIQKFHADVKQLQFEYKNDTFGKLRKLEISDLLIVHTELQERFAKISQEEKSLFNNKEILSDIWSIIQDIRETAISLIKCGAGKQTPVRVWLAGPPGMGKTETLTTISMELSRVDKSSVYSRTVQDPFFSNYVGQGICLFDDLGQDKDQKGYAEWFQYSSANAETIVGAALEQKGTQFVSRFLIGSSNYTWVKEPISISQPAALGRRRDFLVYVHNKDLAQYKMDHKGSSPDPDWWLAHPSQLWLVDPIYPWHQGNSFPNMKDIADSGFTHECVIGRVTSEELLMLMIEKEKEYAEMYRRKLLAYEDKLPFTIPPPFDYDTNFTDISNYMVFRDARKDFAVQKVRQYVEMTSEEGSDTTSISTGASFSSEEVADMCIYQPCKSNISHKIVNTKVSVAMNPLGYIFSPGVPNSQLVNFTKNTVEYKYFNCSSQALLVATGEHQFDQYLINSIETHPHWIHSNYVDIDALATYMAMKQIKIPLIGVEPADTYKGAEHKITDVITDVFTLRYDGQHLLTEDQMPQVLTLDQLPPQAIFWERNHYTYRVRDKCECPKCKRTLGIDKSLDESFNKHAPLPTRIQHATTRRALLIMGDPGVGKTACLTAAFGVDLVRIQGYEDLQPGKICWLDDITSSNHRMSEAKRIIEAFNEDRLHIAGLVMTGNPNTAEWKMYPDTKLMIERRCTVITVNYSSKYMISHWFDKLACANAIKDLPTHERAKHLSVKTVSPDAKHRKLKTFGDIENFLSTFFVDESTQNERIIMEDVFEIPMPENFEYVIKVNATWSDIAEVDLDFIRHNVFPLRRVEREGKFALAEVGAIEYLAFLPKIGNLLAMDVRGNVDQFVRAVNAKRIDSSVPTTVVNGLNFTIGFLTINNILTCFKVIEFATDLEVTTTGVKYDGREYFATFPYDQHYMDVLNKLSQHGKFRKEIPPIPTEQEVELALWAESPFKVIGTLIMSIASLSLSFGAILGLAYSTGVKVHRKWKSKRDMESRSEISSDSDSESDAKPEGKRGVRGGKNQRARVVKKDLVQKKDNADTKHHTDGGVEEPTPKRGEVLKRWTHEGKRGVRGGAKNRERAQAKKDAKPTTHADTRHNTDGGEEQTAPKRGDVISRKWTHESCRYTSCDCPIDGPKKAWNTLEDKNWKYEQYAADILNKDGAIVCMNRLTFGVMFKGQVFYAMEKPIGHWTIMMAPYNNKWVAIDTDSPNSKSKVIGTSNRQIEGIDFSPKPLSIESLNALHRKEFIFDEDFDFGSWLAFSFSRGVPYDAFNNSLRFECIPTVFKQNKIPIPKPLKQFLTVNYPHLIYEEEFTKEAMADPTFSPELAFIKYNMCNIHKDGKFLVHGLLVKGEQGITVAHPFQLGDKIEIIPLKQGTEDNRKFSAVIDKVATDFRDIARFKVVDPLYKQCKNILNHVISSEDFTKTIGKYKNGFPVAFMSMDEEGFGPEVKFVGADPLIENSQRFGANGTYRAVVKGLMVSGISKFGDCGAVLMLLDKTVNAKLCAIHHSGNSTGSMGAYFTRENLTDFMLDIDEKFVKESLTSSIPLRPNPHIIMNTTTKRDTKTGLLVVGSPVKQVHVPGTSREYRTGITIPEMDNFEPSVLNTDDPRNAEDRSMYTEALSRYGKGLTPSDAYDGIIEEGIAGIANEISNHLISLNLDMEVFSTTEAINGPGYINYERSRPIDRTGSIGFPYNVLTKKSTKGDCLEQNPRDAKWYFKKDKDSQRVLSDVNGIVEDAKKGTARIHPFTAYLKDEPLKLKKIYNAEDMKTRMFFSGEFAHLLAYRRYYEAFLYRMTEINNMIPPKVGISMNMEEWTRFTFSLLAVSDTGFASDMRGFDSSVPTKYMKAIPRLVNAVYRRCDPNWKEEDDLVRTVLHLAMEGAHVLSGKKVFKLEQAQVSGNPGTATENSLIMWLLYFCVFKILAIKHAPHLASYVAFRKMVSLAVYGDDNLCTVAPEIQSWFHFNSFKDVAKEFGFDVTDAGKLGGDIPDIINIREMTFLKRSFVEKDGIWLCPIEESSLGKMIHWIKDNPGFRVTEETIGNPPNHKFPISHATGKIEDSINMLWKELSLHGKKYYEEKRDLILKQASRLDLHLQPPTWQEAAAQLGYYFMDY